MRKLNYCKKKFGGANIKKKKKCDTEWPLRSCDSTLLDYFLWGYFGLLESARKFSPEVLELLFECL